MELFCCMCSLPSLEGLPAGWHAHCLSRAQFVPLLPKGFSSGKFWHQLKAHFAMINRSWHGAGYELFDVKKVSVRQKLCDTRHIDILNPSDSYAKPSRRQMLMLNYCWPGDVLSRSSFSASFNRELRHSGKLQFYRLAFLVCSKSIIFIVEAGGISVR